MGELRCNGENMSEENMSEFETVDVGDTNSGIEVMRHPRVEPQKYSETDGFVAAASQLELGFTHEQLARAFTEIVNEGEWGEDIHLLAQVAPLYIGLIKAEFFIAKMSVVNGLLELDEAMTRFDKFVAPLAATPLRDNTQAALSSALGSLSKQLRETGIAPNEQTVQQMVAWIRNARNFMSPMMTGDALNKVRAYVAASEQK